MRIFIVTALFVSAFFTYILLFPPSFLHSEHVYRDDEQRGLDEQIVINFSHVVAENTPKGLAAQKFAKVVNERSDGKVKVEVFSNSVLYSDTEEVDALRRNDVQMIAPSFSKLADLNEDWLLFDLPFMFKDEGEVEAALNGQIGKSLQASLKKENLKGLAFWNNGFKQMTSSQKKLAVPDDFKGQRFRIMPSEVIKKQFDLLDAKPTIAPFNRVYESLEKQEFDGQENTISNIYSKRLYMLQRYMTISNHGYLGYAVMMDESYWNSLPPDVQLLLSNAMEETTAWMWEHSKGMNEQQLEKIKNESSIQVHYLTEQERDKWKQRFKPLYTEFQKRLTKDIVEETYKK
ncbi:DctP family TRAP transporter solute-binding subunit [Priestia flexa]|uniref:DctP family TRAP transporter solute-binding subunit n=1 Tax=Priestia flexa TaxID=86664 RepID=UPI00077C7D16|nr:DctP family TRAP transporter solute-binding subunit [Priestia flexa]MED4590086.1 DctP family TRAP transporter solute-binding subunit [Priestia flexa]